MQTKAYFPGEGNRYDVIGIIMCMIVPWPLMRIYLY